jgi:hypothetical protein
MPICGKTLREMSYNHAEIPVAYGWPILVIVPVILLTAAAFWFARRAQRGQTGEPFARWSLAIASWLYYALNFAFFRYPWPWEAPTTRSPSAIVFAACLLVLTLASVFYPNTKRHRPALRPERAANAASN